MKFSQQYYELKFPSDAEERRIITHDEIKRYGDYRAFEEAMEHPDMRGQVARQKIKEMANEDKIYNQSL